MVKKTLSIIACCIFFCSLPAFSQNYDFNNNQNAPSSYNNRNSDCTDYPVVSGIERNALGRTFQYENIYQRVSRLESNILGTTFPQEALCDRIDRIKKAASDGNQTPLDSQMQSMLSSFNDNSSYDNQYSTSSSTNSTGLQKVLEYAMPIVSQFIGSKYGYNNSNYDPGYSYDYSGFLHTGFGTGVHILP
jgi:hypothetical protein